MTTGKEAQKLIEDFDKLFYGDSWRWVKHDHMQIGYDFFLVVTKLMATDLKKQSTICLPTKIVITNKKGG